MEQPGRNFSNGGGYRYGFNGKENDKDAGEGVQDYGMRIYDGRLGRFFSVDPLTRSYPYYTPYQFAGNMPIWAIDVDGLEPATTNGGINKDEPDAGSDLAKSKELKGVTVQHEEKKSWWSRALDFAKKEIVPRVWGALKTAGGAALVFGGAALSEFGIGIPIAIYGADLAQSGARQVIDGESHSTITNQAFQYAGMSPEAANTTETIIGGAAGNETNTFLTTPQVSSTNNLSKVDLFGGKNGGGNGRINYDLAADEGIADDVANFSNHFGRSSVSEVVANNPQAPFLNQVENAMVSGGTITVRGNMANKFFKNIWNGKAAGMENFKVVSTLENVPNPGYQQTSGSPVVGQINEIILMKK